MVFILESCLEIGTTAAIFLLKMNHERFANPIEIFSSALAFILSAALIIAPIYIFIAGINLYKAKKRNDRETVKRLLPFFGDKKLRSIFAI